MAGMADRRAGFHSVTPPMVVGDLEGAVSFLRTVFGAVAEVHADRPAEIRIGDSLVMITQAGEREVFPAFLYVYVEDLDAAHQRAVATGAVSLEEPTETPYGHRRAMVPGAPSSRSSWRDLQVQTLS